MPGRLIVNTAMRPQQTHPSASQTRRYRLVESSGSVVWIEGGLVLQHSEGYVQQLPHGGPYDSHLRLASASRERTSTTGCRFFRMTLRFKANWVITPLLLWLSIPKMIQLANELPFPWDSLSIVVLLGFTGGLGFLISVLMEKLFGHFQRK